MKPIECPSCGQKSLIQRSSDVFQCISCRFKQDFASPERNQFSIILLITIPIILGLIYFNSNSYQFPRNPSEFSIQSPYLYPHSPP
jgi:uncharacterized protein (DUF983 family)